MNLNIRTHNYSFGSIIRAFVISFAFTLSFFAISMVQASEASSVGQCRQLFQAAHGSQFGAAWQSPSLKAKMMMFFRNGVLKDAPGIAEDLISKTNEIFQSNPTATDEEVYLAQRKIILDHWDEFQIAYHKDDASRVINRGRQLKSLFKTSPKSYLDVGAGDGSIAFEMMRQWGLFENNVYGIEVGHYDEKKPIHWLNYNIDGSIPLNSSSIQAISLLMVLHHIKDPAQVLSEIRRILSDDGLLIVRETDAFNEEERSLNQVLDTMFYRVFSANPTIPLPNNYLPRKKWTDYISALGFTIEREVSLEPHNPFSPVYLIFRKSSK